ncbi:MAG: sodium:proton antiporter [Armatimonadota bacterium]
MSPTAYLAAGIFVAAYALIATEKVDKTKVALAGAALMILLGIIDQDTAFHGTHEVEGIDWNTIFLLMGMMIIVNVTRATGLFEWVAIKTAKLGHGRPIPILIGMCLSTAVLSALLDNVTTVLLIAPTIIVIYEALELDPVPFLIFVILASNIGGTATLVGDPPNIIIASQANITFMEFVYINGPIILLIFLLFAGLIWLGFGKRYQVEDEQRLRVMQFDEARAITDHRLLWRCLTVIGLVLVGFVLHGALHLQPATIALAGAALIMLLHPDGPRETLEEIEWPTIFFFLGLFVMVAGLVEVGVVEALGRGMIDVTHGSSLALTMVVLWFSAIASGIIDNIPFVATMAALLRVVAPELAADPSAHATAAELVRNETILPVWWALSLGACLGGNITLIGASANVVVAGISSRSGHPIGFGRFLKYGLPMTVVFLGLCTGYLWLRFFR